MDNREFDEYKSRRITNNENNDYTFRENNNNMSNYEAMENEDYILGKVISVSCDSEYKRYPWEKIIDKCIYGQRFSNTNNSIYIRCQNNEHINDRIIVIYGKIKGGISRIDTGMSIRAYGKYNNKNEFMAKTIILNNNVSIEVQNEINDYLFVLFPFLIVFILVLLINMFSMIGNIVDSINIYDILVPFVIIFSIVAFLMKKFTKFQMINRIKYSFFISLIIQILIWIK